MGKLFNRLKTITKHKIYVMKACFKSKLIWQGLTHDLSKYSFTELLASVNYDQGNTFFSSEAWVHHKNINKHHWQHWLTISNDRVFAARMPAKYVAEMLCDWIGAEQTYGKEPWTIDTLKKWYKNNRDKMIFHNSTRVYINMLMVYVEDENDLYRNWINIEHINHIYDLEEELQQISRYHEQELFIVKGK